LRSSFSYAFRFIFGAASSLAMRNDPPFDCDCVRNG
jgi:hypothetical protein